MPIARELRHLYRTPSWRALLELLRTRSGRVIVKGWQGAWLLRRCAGPLVYGSRI